MGIVPYLLSTSIVGSACGLKILALASVSFVAER